MVVFNRPEISPPPSLAEYQYHEVEDQLSDDLDDLPPPIPISQLMNELEKNLATSSPSLTHDFTNHLSSSHVVPNVRATSFLSQPPPHLRSTPVLISSSKRTLNTTELQSSDSFPTKNLNKGATQAVLMGARTWHFKAKRSTINNDRNSGVFRKTLVPPSGTANSVAGSSEMGLKSPLKIPPLKEDVPLDIQFQDEVVKKPITEDLSAQVKELAKLVRTTMNSLSSDDIEAQTEDFTDPQYKKKKKKKKVKKKNNKQSSNTTSCKDGDEKEEEEESDEEEVVHPSHHHDPRFLHLANSNFKFIEMLPDRVKHVTFQHDFSEALDAFKHKQYRVALTELTKCFPIVTSNRNYALLYFDRAILHGCLNNLPRAFEDINEAIRLSSKVHNTIPSIGDRSPQEQPFSLRLLADFFFCRSVLHRMSGDYLFAGNDSQMAKQLLSSISTTSTSSSSTDSKEEDDSLAFEEEKLKKLSLTEPAKLRKESKTNEQIFEDACETPPKERTQEQLHFLMTFSKEKIPFFGKLQDDLIFLLWQHLYMENWEQKKIVFVSHRKISCFIVIQGNIRVETEVNGVKESFRTLTNKNWFCEASMSENLWTETTLLTTAFTKILLLSENIYKYTLKNLMLDESIKRMHFFRKLNLFEKWTQEQVEAIAIISEQLFFPANSLIVKEKTPVEHLYFIYRGMASAFRSLTQQLPQQQALVAVKDEEVTIKNGVMDNTDPVNVDNFFFDKVAKKKKNTFDKSKEEKEVEVQLGQLGSEDIFGEAAIFEPLNGFFPASIRADTICEIIRIEKHLFAKQKGIIFLRMGPVDVDFLKKLKHFCFRCPSDKLLIQRIQDKCKWEKKKHKTMKKIYQEKIKTNKSTSIGR